MYSFDFSTMIFPSNSVKFGSNSVMKFGEFDTYRIELAYVGHMSNLNSTREVIDKSKSD